MNSAKTHCTISGMAAEVEDQISLLEALDKEAEAKVEEHQGTQNKGCLVSLGSFLMLFGVGALVQNGVLDGWPIFVEKGLLGLACLGIVGGVIMAVVGSSAASMAAKGDIDDARYQALARLHNFLRMDCEETAQFEYTLDFRSFWDKTFFEREDKFGGWFSYPKGSFKFYSMPVITGRLKLRDGTIMKILVERKSRVKDYQKKNYRGKVKAKWKVKFQDQYRIDLKLPGPVGDDFQPAHQPSKANHFSGRGPQIKIQGNKVSALLRVKSGTGPVDSEPILQLATWAFQSLKSKRAA